MGLAGRERLDKFPIESVNAKVESEMSDKLRTASSLQSSVASLETGLTRVLDVGWGKLSQTKVLSFKCQASTSSSIMLVGTLETDGGILVTDEDDERARVISFKNWGV